MENRNTRTLQITAGAAVDKAQRAQARLARPKGRAPTPPKQRFGRRHGSVAVNGTSWRQLRRHFSRSGSPPMKATVAMMKAHDWYYRPHAARS